MNLHANFLFYTVFNFYVWIFSNDMDFSEPSFVTKIPNFRSSKGPNKKCFLIRELQMRKLFHWHYVFTPIWYLEQEPKWALPKSFARCDEIMRRDEIRWFDGTHITREILCTYDLYSPVHNVLDACISIMWGSGRGLGPWIPDFFGPCEMGTSP